MKSAARLVSNQAGKQPERSIPVPAGERLAVPMRRSPFRVIVGRQRGQARWLTVGLTCLAALLPWSIAACAETRAAIFGSESTASTATPPATSPAPAETAFADKAIAAALAKRLEATTPIVLAGQQTPIDRFASFYQSRQYEPVWVNNSGLTPQGTALIASLKKVNREGFDARLYMPTVLSEPGASADDLAETELAISAGLVRYANDATIGRSPPRRNDPNTSASEKIVDPTAVLLSAADATEVDAYVDTLPPQDRIYKGLQEALRRYRALEKSGTWQPLSATLQPGVNGEAVRSLRQSFVLMGDLPADADTHSTHYGEDVTAAVRRFQHRHALPLTGTMDATTRNAYNVPPDTRVRQILVNMERRRWMPTDLGANHIFVNLADYKLNVIENDKSVLEMRVVVGKPTWPSPVFSDVMEYMEFNPYWHVPPGILKKEVLPKMRSNPGYASAAGLKVYQNGRQIDPADVDWAQAGGGYSFRQDPGERNALGRMKFMFPNPYSVYLHDTPSKSLFNRSDRAFSHGCIRLEKPMELAVYVLNRNSGEWDQNRIERTIGTRRNSSVRLKEPLPVHLAYFTVWLDGDGSVQFRNDVYGRDATLERTLSASAD